MRDQDARFASHVSNAHSGAGGGFGIQVVIRTFANGQVRAVDSPPAACPQPGCTFVAPQPTSITTTFVHLISAHYATLHDWLCPTHFTQRIDVRFNIGQHVRQLIRARSLFECQPTTILIIRSRSLRQARCALSRASMSSAAANHHTFLPAIAKLRCKIELNKYNYQVFQSINIQSYHILSGESTMV